MTPIIISPENMTKVISILTDWVIRDLYEYDTCRDMLNALGIDEDTTEWLMETVNFMGISDHDMETYLSERIDEYNRRDDEHIYHYENDECGHDIYLSRL